MQLLFFIAVKHLMARKRQSFVSLLGIVLGVGFFLAISSLMSGSEKDFLKRLVDNSPHITIYDEYRAPSEQPLFKQYTNGAVELRNVKPVSETRGIRGHEQIMEYLRTLPGVNASGVLTGQALVSSAGKDYGVTLNGMVPEEVLRVTTIESNMREGSINNLIANPDGIIIGSELAKKLSLKMNDNITVTAPTGEVRVFKILGIFRTGRNSYDEGQAFVGIKRVQALMNRSNRVNTIIMKMPAPYQALALSKEIEAKVGYKTVSWQEMSEDLMNTIAIRNKIMYTVVSAVLIVAAFGIYNVISTVVMEKQRDIAILKSMGFHADDVQRIFLIQGVLLGLAGCAMGIPLGCGMMLGLMQISIKAPGASVMVQMPIDWGVTQFIIAIGFALSASIFAAYLPSRKAARVQPVEILRGGM